MKKLLRGLVAAVLGAVLAMGSLSAVCAGEEPDINVIVDGFLIELTAKPFIQDGYTLVGMRDIFEVLGADVRWEPVMRKVYGTKGDTKVDVTVDSTEAYVNLNMTDMPIAPRLVGDKVMVPLRFISESFDAKVDWDEVNNAVIIDTAAPDYSAVAADRTVNTPQDEILVTYEEALKRLERESSSIKSLRDSKAILEENLDDTKKQYFSTTNMMNLANVALARNMRSLENKLDFFEENVQNMKDTLELGMRKLLTSIYTTEQDIYLLKQRIVIEERELKNLELKLSLGMAKETDVVKAEQNLTQSKTNLTNAETGLNSVKLELSAMLGYDQRDSIRVVMPEAALPKSDTVDRYVGQQLAQSFAIREKEVALSEAEYGIFTHENFLYTDYQNQESLTDLENKLDAATLALRDTKTELEKVIRKAYNDIVLQDQTYASLTIDYDKAVDAYKQTVVNYLTGRATISNLDNARLGILTAEIAMEKNRMTLSDMLFSYEKPHLQLR